MKQFLSFVLLSVTLLGSLFLLSSCSSKTYNGIFYYSIKSDSSNGGQKYIYISKLTKTGEALKAIYVPEYIDGLPVQKIGFNPIMGSNSFGTDNTERVYLPKTVKSAKVKTSPTGKIIYLSSEANDDRKSFCNPYFSQIDDISKNHAEVEPNKYANVVYLYNYEDAPDGGIYSLDDYDNESILYPPENIPVRDGYTFAGWYKEKECITPWDFANDIIPSKEFYDYDIEGDDGVKYIGEKQKLLVTQLFAKWEKIS